MAAREAADAVALAGVRAAADALARSEAQEHQTRVRLETILHRMPLGCMVGDAELRMTYASTSCSPTWSCLKG